MIQLNPFSLAARIKRPLILDGATGSILQKRIGFDKSPLWTSEYNITYPEEVLRLHSEYIESGADIITTNTFRTNPLAVKLAGTSKSYKQYLNKAVKIALEAAAGTPVLVAGSNPPAEDCYKEDRTISNDELIDNHKKHISALMDAGCDFVLNETQSHMDEIRIILEFCSKKEIPFIICLYLTDELRLLSGEPLHEVTAEIKQYNPMAIGFNCIFGLTFGKLVNKEIFNYNWGYYLNCGSGNFTYKEIKCDLSPINYAEIISDSLKYDPSFVGGCCGSSPSHIKTIRRLFNEKSNYKISGKNQLRPERRF
ncbi:MAG TPA: homocysteine S-methyltransferase family protein [Ignavibacteriaceae bacterium]|nr:homocysteine S-methyltransferase family protein [Ignavibacteriaceae bacterium]